MANEIMNASSQFWEDSDYAREEYVSEPFNDETLTQVEKELGYKLPESYINLLKTQNGGIPINTCAPSNEPTSWASDHAAIAGIFGIGREKSYSLCGSLGSQFMIDEWEYPKIGVYICDCPSAGHDMIALDYRECGKDGEPKVVHVDQDDDYKVTFLAENFSEFIKSLKHEDEFE
ncbi:SMI1/KNR4 family protein [Vibrio sp. S4M6]|uniref:SMI1/KNR4 family protein n=1 Tax=Vibrio sinus TaxID=2946865 RepID=UPI00202A117B|nr:SMI1/KNR4 family protein [Vibrio sinus]MCL9782108.1 SMI1/KNR4 family protein [Vibrio sinus]